MSEIGAIIPGYNRPEIKNTLIFTHQYCNHFSVPLCGESAFLRYMKRITYLFGVVNLREQKERHITYWNTYGYGCNKKIFNFF